MIQTEDMGPLQQEEPMLRWFSSSHLPEPLRNLVNSYATMAGVVIGSIPKSPERTVALRKLLESKDSAVRGLVDKNRETQA